MYKLSFVVMVLVAIKVLGAEQEYDVLWKRFEQICFDFLIKMQLPQILTSFLSVPDSMDGIFFVLYYQRQQRS